MIQIYFLCVAYNSLWLFAIKKIMGDRLKYIKF